MKENLFFKRTPQQSCEFVFNIIGVQPHQESKLLSFLDKVLEAIVTFVQAEENSYTYWVFIFLFILLHYYITPLYGGVVLYIPLLVATTYIFVLPSKIVLVWISSKIKRLVLFIWQSLRTIGKKLKKILFSKYRK